MTVAGVSGLLLTLRSTVDTFDVFVVLLAIVAGISMRADIRTSIAGALAAFLAFNFFFTPPYYTFFVANMHDLLGLIAFLGLSITISTLVTRSRSRALDARRRHRQTETLYQLSIALISANDLDAVLASVVDGVQRVLDLSAAAVLLASDDQLNVGATAGEPLDLADKELLDRARWSMEHGTPASISTFHNHSDTDGAGQPAGVAAGHELLLVPVATSAERIGILIVARRHDQMRFDPEASRLVVTFANQAALAIERSLLTEQRTLAAVLSRTDELKSALLSAVSHDLRTPLASIKASVTTLLQTGIVLSDKGRRELLEAIDEEADRLNKLVANLLDLSRIEAGALIPALDWYEPAEIVGEALERCQPLLKDHSVSIRLPEPPVWVHVDFVMICEVLTNLLENAAKYSPPGRPVQISARSRDGTLEFTVTDEGLGVPAGEEERIFDKFYRVEARHRPVGSGMGLAISRGFVEAHGGRIWVKRSEAGGASFVFSVPLAEDLESATGAGVNRVARP